jgi:hypothetical protein
MIMKKWMIGLLVTASSLELQGTEADQNQQPQISSENSFKNNAETALLELKQEQKRVKKQQEEARAKIKELEQQLQANQEQEFKLLKHLEALELSYRQELDQAKVQLQTTQKEQEQSQSKVSQLEKQLELNLKSNLEERANLLRQIASIEGFFAEEEKKRHAELANEQERNNQQFEKVQQECNQQFEEARSKIAQLEEQCSNNSNAWQDCCQTIGICPDSCPGWIFGVDVLYWKADIPSNDYALFQTKDQVVFNRGVDTPAVNGLLGPLKNQHFNWNPGFRAELGYLFKRDLWNLKADYTYYYTEGHQHLSAPNAVIDPTILPTINISFPSGLSITTYAKNSNTLNYNVANLRLAKDFMIGRKLWLQFLAGATAAFIHEKMHVKVNDFAGALALHRWSWDYKGGGIKMGFDSRWNLGKRFNLLLGAFGSALYGTYVNKYNANFYYPPTDIDTPVQEVGDDMHFSVGRTIYSAQTVGGIAWNRPFCGMNLEISFQYELNTWFGLNQRYFPLYYNESNYDKVRIADSSNVNLQGITAGINLTY